MNEDMLMEALSGIMSKLDELSMEVTAKKLPGQEAAMAEKPFGGMETPEEEAAEAGMGEAMEAGEEKAEEAVEGTEMEDEEEDQEEASGKPVGKLTALEAVFAKKPAK